MHNRDIGGLALGPLIAAVLARYEQHGLTLPYQVFIAGYAGLSILVLGLGTLQHLSPRITLLILAVIVVLGILAAAPVLVRPPDANPALTSS